MGIFKIFVFVLILSASTQKVFAKIEVDHESFAAAGLSELSRLIESDIAWLPNLRGNGGSPLHREFFGGNVNGQLYKQFLDSRIDRIVYISPDEMARKAGRAVGAFYSRKSKTVTMNELNLAGVFGFLGQDRGMDRIGRLALLIHEAGHAKVGHIDCPSGGFKNGCDSGYNGAYGIEVNFLLNVARYCQNCVDNNSSNRSIDEFARTEVFAIVSEKSRDYLLKDAGELPSWNSEAPGKRWDW